MACRNTQGTASDTLIAETVQYGTEAPPSWVSFNAITGNMIVNTPSVTEDTTYMFYFKMKVSNDQEDEFSKLITLKVIATSDNTEEIVKSNTTSEEQLETAPEGKLTM